MLLLLFQGAGAPPVVTPLPVYRTASSGGTPLLRTDGGGTRITTDGGTPTIRTGGAG